MGGNGDNSTDAAFLLVAATASLGAAVLVWTGLALALRRLLRSWRSRERAREDASPEASPL